MGELPHVTVWLPVYKESLEEVIPTVVVESLPFFSLICVNQLQTVIANQNRDGSTLALIYCLSGLQRLHCWDDDFLEGFLVDCS
jgi:hypothetical protein